jgi:hypothetical protein
MAAPCVADPCGDQGALTCQLTGRPPRSPEMLRTGCSSDLDERPQSTLVTSSIASLLEYRRPCRVQTAVTGTRGAEEMREATTTPMGVPGVVSVGVLEHRRSWQITHLELMRESACGPGVPFICCPEGPAYNAGIGECRM